MAKPLKDTQGSRSVGHIQHRAIRGSAVALFGFVLAVLQTVVQVPLLLHYLGSENYGIWLAVFAAYSLISCLDMGHQAYVGNLIYARYSQDAAQTRRLLGSGLKVTAFICGAEVMLAFGVIGAARLGVNTGIPASWTAGFALLVLVLHYVSSVAFAGMAVKYYAPAGLYTVQALWYQGLRLAQFVLTSLVVVCGGGVLSLALVYALTGVVGNLLQLRDCARRFGSLEQAFAEGDFKEGMRNWRQSLVFSLNLVFDQSGQSGLLLLLARSASAATVPVLSTLRTACNTFIMVFNTFHFPVFADLARYHTAEEYHKVVGIFRALWFVQGWVVYFGMLISIPVFEWIYPYWTHGQLPFERGLFLLLLMMVAIRSAGSPLYSFYYTVNDLPVQTAMTLCRALPPLLYLILLYRTAGLSGLGWTILLAEALASGVVFGYRWVTTYEKRYPAATELRSAATLEAIQLGGFGLVAISIWHWPKNMVEILPVGIVAGLIFQLCRWRQMPGDLRVRVLDGLAQFPGMRLLLGHGLLKHS